VAGGHCLGRVIVGFLLVFYQAAPADARGGIFHKHGEILFNIGYIGIVEFYLAVGFIPFEGHGSTAGKQEEYVGGVVVEKLLEGIYKAIAKTEEGNKNEDPQSHRKARQEGPKLVFTDGFEYFIPCIPAKHEPRLLPALLSHPVRSPRLSGE